MRTRMRILLQLIIDLILLNLSALLIAFIGTGSARILFSHEGKVLLLMNLAWTFSYIIYVDDLTYFKSKLWYVIGKMGKTTVLFIAVFASGLLLQQWSDFPHHLLFWTIVLFCAFKLTADLGLFYFSPVKNKPNMRPAVIVGNNSIGNELYNYFLKNQHLGLDPVGILDMYDGKNSNHHLIGSIEDFQKIYDAQPFQDVVIALPLSEKTAIKRVIDYAERNGVRPHIAPNYFGIMDKVFKVKTIGNIPLLTYRSLPLDRYPNRFWKRAFDIVFTTVALLLLSPFLVLIAIAIKLDSAGPVFYRPVRLGVNSNPFRVFKFRSMKHVNETAQQADSSTVKDDYRITKVGKFLRKFNLDELPQLINVLMNDMSVVGPRPHRLSLNKSLEHKIKTYRVRHLVKPGITGWAQVNGYRGPTATRLQYTGRILHDLWYLEHWNFWLDIYIIFLTVFSKKAYKNAF